MDFARSAHAGVQAQLDRLPALSAPGDHLGLERITAMLGRLGRPQDRLPPVFHVAGTNGKGSTVAFLRAALEAAGHSVHAYTSPHLVRFNERIRIAGRLVDDEALAALLSETIDVAGGLEPSFFEVATASALLAFARTPADAVILEVGLGGRLDATNVIDRPLVTGIASIGLDHQQYLGDTLSLIAAEKAGIAKRDVPLVSLAQPADAEAAIARITADIAAPLLLEGRDWTFDPGLVPALPGPHQLRNANLAWAMLEAQDVIPVRREQFLAGLQSTRWPARFQKLAPGPIGDTPTWIDGAHNGDAAEALAATLAGCEPMHLIVGILANKSADAIVAPLRKLALSLTFVPVGDHAHHDPAELVSRFGGTAAASLGSALDRTPGPRLVAGSLYLAGQLLALNRELPD
ncbi:MAG: folylpolyglutamate synthase/dihydrofolate synthase family protein [Sphingomicrobium sp.]